MKNIVLQEVMEAEMIMTGLCDEDLEKHIPEDLIED